MLSALLVLGLVYAAAGQKCCVPPQFETIVAVLGGEAEQGSAPVLTVGGFKLAYDAVGQKVAANETLYQGSRVIKVQVIMDFKKGTQYTIENGKCYKSKLPQWKAYCIPGSARSYGGGYFGGPSDSLTVQVYDIATADGQTMIWVTKPCIPVLVDSFSGSGQFGSLATYKFLNMTLSIPDPSIFTPPAICNQFRYFSPPPLGLRSLQRSQSILNLFTN